MAEYMTIAQFARAAGKSHTWISKLTKTTLKPYVQQDGNRTMIDATALQLFKERENTDTESNARVQELKTKIETLRIEIATIETERKRLEMELTSREQETERLMQTVETLTQQLAVKDSQITSLHQLIDQQQRLQLQMQLPTKTSWWSRLFGKK